MNLLQKLFHKSKLDESTNIHTAYDAHEQLLVEKVIEMLKTKPEYFSARWSTGNTMDYSVRSNNNNILIMISDGSIIKPVEPKMTKEQKRTVISLIEPIVKRDSDYIIEKLICNSQV